ncbi:MAG: HAD hydrolase-like protein [Candidatus Hydrogenedentota bacterium]
MPIRHIVWDWNGTLLDDLDLCLTALHELTKARGIPPVDLETYREKFTFPVVEYYKALGFDPSPEAFEEAAREWVKMYTDNVYSAASLYEGAVESLERLREAGLRQCLVSAHQHDMLLAAVRHFGLTGYFDTIRGLHNHYAESKTDLGKQWLAEINPPEDSVLMVGDTLHDFEVAEELDVQCLLIAQGHQSERRLRATGAPVIPSVRDVPAFLAF